MLAKTWSKTPSQHLGLELGTYEAYRVDEAVAWFGNSLQSKLESVKGKTDKQREQKRRLLLHNTFAGELGGPKFRDPMAKFVDPEKDDVVVMDVEGAEQAFRDKKERR